MRYTRRIKNNNHSAQQPAKCRGCVWGRLEGSTQFCMKPVGKCDKENGGNKRENPKRLGL